ncbi:hypothetical protein VPHF86_0281 [Vibrio phage F86]
MSLYDNLVSKVKDNRSQRATDFTVKLRKSIADLIDSSKGYRFPLKMQITLDSQSDACSEYMTLIHEVLRDEGFFNFDAEFGRHDADYREYNAVSFSYVTLLIRENNG